MNDHRRIQFELIYIKCGRNFHLPGSNTVYFRQFSHISEESPIENLFIYSVVNRTCDPIKGRSVKITSTVPL